MLHFFSARKVRIIKSFSPKGLTKSVRTTKSLNYKVSSYRGFFHKSLLGNFKGTGEFHLN